MYIYIGNAINRVLMISLVPVFWMACLLTSYSAVDLAESESKLKGVYEKLDGRISSEQREKYIEEANEIWRRLLSTPESFDYPFDSLTYVGKILSPDSLLRIYTWNLSDEKGLPLYFGFMQVRDREDGKVTYYELLHNKQTVKDFERAVVDYQNWYGALYYEIIPVGTKKGVYYTLLGFDMNNSLTNKKIIDVMYWENRELKFGAPMFVVDRSIQHRVIFEYSSRVMMSLRFNKKMSMIVHDHLSPSNPQFTGQYQFYGPDFSFDGFVFENDRWKQVVDLDVQNL